MARHRVTRAAEAAAEAGVEGVFASAQPSPTNSVPSMSPEYERVIDNVFAPVDPERDYEKLERDLALREALTPGALSAALNLSEDNARIAHRLYVAAKLDFERFEAESDAVRGALRDAAVAELQKEKDAGQRSKAITETDTNERAATMFPDEWRDIQGRRAPASGALEHLKRRADLWQARCYSLGTMLNAGRQR